MDMGASDPGPHAAPADFTLRIAPVAVEIAPSRFISTIGYNGTSPGPVLRMREGKPVTVDVINDSDAAELVHWHGLFLPAQIDGAEEEGTPVIPAGARRRYRFTPRPAGTRWYHSHAMAMGDLHRGSYTGQYGFRGRRFGSRPRGLRPGDFSRSARLGTFLYRPVRRHGRSGRARAAT